MPSVNDIMEMAELLRSRSVVAVEDHCVAVRNRNAKCRKCVDVCMAGAIEVALNKLTVDAGACVGCGACVAACPTEALVSLDPMQEDLAVAISAAIKQAGGMAVFACARMAARQVGDPEKYATVPCLGRIDEETLVAIASHGVDDITLVDGTCSTCKYRAVSPCIDTAVETAIALLEAMGSDAMIMRSSAFPSEVEARDERSVVGASRRRFFSSAGGYARNVAMTAAEKAVADALHQNQQKKLLTLRERLGAGKSGKLPTFEAERNMRLLDDMSRIGEETGTLAALLEEADAVRDAEGAANALAVTDGADASAANGEAAANGGAAAPAMIDTRLFGSLSIDASSCSGCGMCVMFCPTEALKYSTLEEPENEEARYLEFQAADCTQCRMCVDVCLRRCVELSSEVSVAELFDFEPRLIEIPKPPKAASILARRHGREKK